MSRIRKTKDSRGVVDEGVRVCINSPSTTAPAMTKAMMKWGTKTHTHFWPRGGSHQVTHLALTLWPIGRIGETSHAKMNKEWEVRMIPPGDGCDDNHSWHCGCSSLLCALSFLWNFGEILTNRQQKANGFFQWWGYWVSWLDFGELNYFPMFWWGFKLAKTNLVRLKKFEPFFFGEVIGC